jgi:hypothetical protein
MAALATAAHTNGNIIFEFEIHQRTNGLAELHLLMYNVTRWEGRKSCLERAIEMKESLQCLLDHAIVLDQCNKRFRISWRRNTFRGFEGISQC